MLYYKENYRVLLQIKEFSLSSIKIISTDLLLKKFLFNLKKWNQEET